MTRIPANLDEVTPAWIAECLGPEPTSLRLAPMAEGVGMMSDMAIIHLGWPEGAGQPDSLVIKIAAGNDTNRAVARQFRLYLKEVSYYRDLAPRTRARSPRVYASGLDQAQNFFLLMENVSDYRMGSQLKGATLKECQLCIDFLAKLHASFRDNLENVDWLPSMSNSENAKNMVTGCELGWTQLLDYFGEFVPDNINAHREDYIANIGNLQEKLDQPPGTLIHGDFRMDNMLFGQKPEHEPLMVVDFQGPLKGNGIHDLAYLMSHSARTDVRREHEQSLLRRYVDGLAAEGVTGYDYETAWQDYRIGVLYAWTVAVVIAGTLDPANERGYAWMSKMVERNGIAINDLDCLELF